jgi:hypothetical protein
MAASLISRSAAFVPGARSSGRATAKDELLDLGEELDLADAATAQLHIEIGRGQFSMAAMRVNLALDRMDVGNCPVVEVPPPDIGLQAPSRYASCPQRHLQRRPAP